MKTMTQRAAKMAFNKARRSYEAARDAANVLDHATLAGGVPENYEAIMAPARSAEEAARLKAVEAFKDAESVGAVVAW